MTANIDAASNLTMTATALVKLESLQASREAVRQLTADNLKAKDTDIKEAKKALTIAVKASGNHIEGCRLCEHFAQGSPGDEGAARTATTRRRTNLKKALESAFPDYDFAGVKAGGRYKFVASIKADPARLELDKLIAAVDRLHELGLLDAAEFKAANSSETILSAIKAAEPAMPQATVPLGINEVMKSGITADDLADFDAKVSALRNRFAAQAVANQ